MSEEALVSAAVFEQRGILPRATLYKMAKAGRIPSYRVGVKQRGVRFRVEEVLAALRRPVVAHGQGTNQGDHHAR